MIQCWESLRSLIPMFLAKGRPVIINLRRIIAAGPEQEPVYTSDYQLTDATKNLVFPDQCPIDITSSQPREVMNIAEEFQLLSRLAEAANQDDVGYAMESRDAPGEVIRLANRTIPFSIKHIYASTYRRENEISQHYAASSKGVKAGKRHKFSELNRHDH